VKLRNLIIGLSGLFVAAAMIAPATAGATVHAGTSARTGGHTLAVRGMGHASAPRLVNVRAAAAGPQIKPHFRSFGPLGRNGKVAGSALPVRRSTGVKSRPAAVAGRANAGHAPRMHLRVRRGPLSPFVAVKQNFEGVTQSGSNCGCQPPDPNAAVSPGQNAEVVNLRLEVYKKTGSGIPVCGVALNTLVGTSASLSDPHIIWDNVNKRFVMVVIPVPSSPSATPTEFLLATTTSSACGSWRVYAIGFSGGPFTPGTLMDYPYLGQDNSPSTTSTVRGAILSSTNLFCCAPSFNSYTGSVAYAIPKAPVYAGAGFSFPAFGVSFSTAPVTTSGTGKKASATTYWLASVPGSGYNLFRMTNSANPGSTALALQASISSPFNAPSRRVNQPGTTQTLDPLDGRIDWAPEIGGSGFIWFAHGIDIAGFPGIRYGAISVTSNTATVAEAFHSSSSDDFNPSIGVTPTTGSQVFIWLNWAYTDTPNGVATSDTVNGVLPGGGVPNLTSGDLVLVNGFTTTTNFRFGDFSSVEIDPKAVSLTCPAGRDAELAQEYFDSSQQWVTRIARVSFC
jgi:hypothetical protein